jgi:hypothetical protein
MFEYEKSLLLNLKFKISLKNITVTSLAIHAKVLMFKWCLLQTSVIFHRNFRNLLSPTTQNHYADLEDTCRDNVTKVGIIVRYTKNIYIEEN